MGDRKNNHTCHAIGCSQNCAPEYLMCKEHWDILPNPRKRSVLREYRKGQCNLKPLPSEQWHDAADAAIYWIYNYELKQKYKQLQYELAEVNEKFKGLEHIGKENDTLVSRLLGVYDSNGVKRDFKEDGYFVPAINKEAALYITQLESSLAEAREANRWIPVSEKPPEDGQPVWVMRDSPLPYHFGCRRYAEGGWYDERGNSTMDIHCNEEVFTHWKPITKPE